MHPTRIIALLVTWLLLAHGNACAVTQEQVIVGAEKLYRVRIDELAQARMLDRDPLFLQRVRRIAQQLIDQARRDHPGAAAMPWEIHTSSDDEGNANCMAGGKILISQPYVERLALSDAELAMVLSHEMQHALLQHNLKEYREALRLEPGWAARPFPDLEEAVDHDGALMSKLASINFEQEIEADREGMAMAWRAGWRASQLAGFYRKLEQAATMSNRGSVSHQAPLQRWRAARRQAEALDWKKN